MTTQSGTQDSDGWGVSCNAADIDNDGWEDFFIANGASINSSANVMFRNNGDKTFSNVTEVIGGANIDGRGIAFADWDNDGDMDFVLTAGPLDDTQMWRNDSPNDNHWVTFKLEGTQSNRSAIGTRITVTTELGSHSKMVSGGAGRGSFNSLPLEFGLGQAQRIINTEVHWPNGLVQNIDNVGLDQIVKIKELSLLMESRCAGSLPVFSITGASPNSQVTLYSGSLTQQSHLRFGKCLGTTIDLSNIKSQGRAMTNSSGEAIINLRQGNNNVCTNLRKGNGLQVVSEATCTTSNLITKIAL